MRIPSGDLAPARRSRRRPGPLPVLLALAVLAVLAVGAYLLLHRSTAGPVAAVRCPPVVARPVPAPPAPPTIRLRLLNGTGRDRLAHIVGAALAARGFRVTAMVTAPRARTGASEVSFLPAARSAAAVVGAQVPDAVLVPVAATAPAPVELILGSGFRRLRTPAEAASYLHAHPPALPVPTAPASGGCR